MGVQTHILNFKTRKFLYELFNCLRNKIILAQRFKNCSRRRRLVPPSQASGFPRTRACRPCTHQSPWRRQCRPWSRPWTQRRRPRWPRPWWAWHPGGGWAGAGDWLCQPRRLYLGFKCSTQFQTKKNLKRKLAGSPLNAAALSSDWGVKSNCWMVLNVESIVLESKQLQAQTFCETPTRSLF